MSSDLSITILKVVMSFVPGTYIHNEEVSIMLGCGCLFALGATFFPRLVLLFTWLFTPFVSRAFHATFILPLLGIIFLPFTTLMYVFLYIPGIGLTSWGWLWVLLGFILDISSYGGSAYGNRNRMPGYNRV